MNRTTLLHATSDLTVSRFDHPPHEVHHDPEREVADRWGIAFVSAGSFDIISDHTRHQLRAGGLLITWPGLEFRCGHDHHCPTDVCLSVRFEPSAVAEVEHAWLRAGWSARTRPTPRLAMVQQRLTAAVDAGDAFESERWAVAALGALAADSQDARARGHYTPSARQVDAVVATCRAIEADPARLLSVADRARAVGMTSTRLTHAFARYLGVSPHQYVVRWRLASAAQLLNEGCSVSTTCYSAGFENLSHFCRTFQRALGSRPSLWRTMPLPERRRKVQALLGGAF